MAFFILIKNISSVDKTLLLMKRAEAMYIYIDNFRLRTLWDWSGLSVKPADFFVR
jgi:hypothetical protein